MRKGNAFLRMSVALLLFPTSGNATDVNLIWSATSGAGTVGGSDISASPGDTLTLDIVVVPDASGVREVSISLSFDSSALSLTSATEVGSPTMSGPITAGLTTSTTAPASGDCNGDGAVGVSDYVQYIVTYGMFVTPGTGCDFDGNGVIGFPPVELPAIFSNYQLGSPTAPAANLALGFEEASTPGSGTQTSLFTLGQATFQVLGAGGTSVDLFFNPKIDGVADGSESIIADSGNPTGVTLNDATVNGGPALVPLLAPWGAAVLTLALVAWGSRLARPGS